ncbi:hypothetical protein WCLP8_4170011 [uncultured Gammaproteobacteria bacterium]
MYFGVCTRITSSPGGTRADLAECPALWAEVDTRKLGLDKETVRKAVTALPHPPRLNCACQRRWSPRACPRTRS